jgi:hypothetical protein
MLSKDKGDITELKCILALKERTINVSIPYGENSSYDLIADFDGRLVRIQCKTSRKGKSKNSFCFNTTTTRVNSSGYKRVDYIGKVDYFMTIFKDIVYMVPTDECGASEKTIRLEKSKNGQVKGISFAEDYLLDKYITL